MIWDERVERVEVDCEIERNVEETREIKATTGNGNG